MHRSIINSLTKCQIGTDRRPSDAERTAQAREREARAIRWALSQIRSEPVAVAAE